MPRILPRKPKRILVLDIGGSHVKVSLWPSGMVFRVPSGPEMGPTEMMARLKRRLKGKRYEVVAIGYPGLVVHGKILREPYNLAMGWVGFNFQRAWHRPTRIVNDAAMQALGSYQGGSMLFLGLGTGLGTAMIVDGRLEPMELAHLEYKKGRTYEEMVGEKGLLRLGRKKWEREVTAVVATLSAALEPDYVVLGGGNTRKLKTLPPGARRGDNADAFGGGVRLWRTPAAASPPPQTTPRPRATARKLRRRRRT
jgi:polyphosphate glucokinase